jgi:hypothetical protein
MPHAPDILPVLSRGKHRSPKKGACFMELASYLAGEKWSDRPACTHPLLAEVARNVNDRISDQARPHLATLIPDVVGLDTDDPRADARIALHCAVAGLEVAPFERQKALAVAVVSSLRVLDALGDDAPELVGRAREALDTNPLATAWAQRFSQRAGSTTSVRRFRAHATHDIVKLAARGVEQAVGIDRDALLREMLEGAIEQCRALQPAPEPAPAVDPALWRQACALTV